MYIQIHIEQERGKGYTVRCEKSISKKVICVFAQEPYGLLQMLFNMFVRSVEDGLEPSQTYDEVNKLLLLQHRDASEAQIHVPSVSNQVLFH